MPTIPYKNKAGQRLQGATTIKSQNIGWGKGGLLYWANQQGRDGKTLNEARDTATISGTIAHHLVECSLLGTNPDLHEYKKEDIHKARIAYWNYQTWCTQFSFEPIAVEPNLVSEKWQYGGTPDVIGKVLGELCVIDWKTGKTYEDLFLQLAAYKVLWEENNPTMPIIGGFHVLRMPKNEDVPSFHHSHWKVLPVDAWGAFEMALNLAKIQKQLKQLL